jgi:hypothetical protein
MVLLTAYFGLLVTGGGDISETREGALGDDCWEIVRECDLDNRLECFTSDKVFM